jgi:hypothetical protein
MPYEQRDNSGSLFKNDKRETDQQPTLKGSAMVGGIEYWVSAWVKVSKTGEKWQSLAFTEKEKAVTAKPSQAAGGDPWDDDLSF